MADSVGPCQSQDRLSPSVKHTQGTSPEKGVTVSRSYRSRLKTDRPLSAASVSASLCLPKQRLDRPLRERHPGTLCRKLHRVPISVRDSAEGPAGNRVVGPAWRCGAASFWFQGLTPTMVGTTNAAGLRAVVFPFSPTGFTAPHCPTPLANASLPFFERLATLLTAHRVACAVVMISNARFVLQIRFMCRSASLIHVLPVKSLQTPLWV
jgi:hypothetical protein